MRTSEQYRTWYARNTERCRANNRRWKAANRAHYNKQQRERRRERVLGVTPERFSAMLASQGGCGICGRKNVDNPKKWHADHDHSTGEVRGVLCFKCNALLGHASDDIVVLGAAIAYLKSPPARRVD